MGGDSRNTQGGQQAAHDGAQGALEAFIFSVRCGRDGLALPPVVDPSIQDVGKGTCPGPAGGGVFPCALPLFHGSDHVPVAK